MKVPGAVSNADTGRYHEWLDVARTYQGDRRQHVIWTNTSASYSTQKAITDNSGADDP
jgi:hypothetical protein